tara:strand:+ start:34 stop:714 length:681 start_codon:yes stop_codon:yes gene_type:complete
VIHKHRKNDISSENRDKFNHLEISHLNQENIFITPIWSMEIECDNENILDECYDLERKYSNGVQKSNVGGWQSNVFDLKTIKKYETPTIQNLAANIIDITSDLLEDYAEENRSSIDYRRDEIGWWININRGYSYNVYHTHPGCSMIAVYYAKVPEVVKSENEEGQLILLRQDAMCYNPIFSNIQSMCESLINPKERYLYLMPSTIAHYVRAHTTEEERVSIAFNIG